MEPAPSLLLPQSLLLLSAVVFGLAPALRRRPAMQRASLNRFSRRVDLPVPDGLRPRVERLLGARSLAADLGVAAGIATVAAWAWITRPEFGETGMWLLVVIGAAVTGAAVAVGASAARQARRGRADDGPRLARATTATVGDYVAPLELQGGRVVAVMPSLFLAGAVVLTLSSPEVSLAELLSVGLATAAVLPVAALAGSEVAGRRLVDQPQPAGSALELAWSDAVRARVLRDLVSVPLVVGSYATFGVLLDVGATLSRGTEGNVLAGVLGLTILGLMATLGLAWLATAFTRPHRHFRRRLWPQGVGTEVSPGAVS